jgi:tetratricopeptide (TPR) repeat protein
VLLDTRDAAAIRDLAGCLQIVEDPRTFDHCACLGGPTLELYAGPEHVATIGLQHGRAIRWQQWYHDARLQDGDRFTRWLHHHGIDPGRLEAIYKRGNNFLMVEPSAASGRKAEALQVCSQAHERALAGQLAEARQLCTRALELDPEQPEVYALRGQVHYHSGFLQEAGADCCAAIDRGLRYAEVYVIRALALDGVGRQEEAIADCSMALHLNPDHAEAYNSRGLIRGRLGRCDEALKDFSEAIRLAPDWIMPYVHRAQLARGRGQLKAAMADYDRAVELVEKPSPDRPGAAGDPGVALLYCSRGDALYDQFREDEADADFAAARRHHPAAAAGNLGDMWLRRGNFARALSAFADLVELCPQHAQGYRGRGVVHEVQGDLEEAAEDYSTAIRLQPDGGGCYVLRAQVRHRQGRVDDALTDLSEHLQRHPDDPMALLFRASLHRERQAWPAALADLNAAHRAAPDNPQVCNNLAWMLATCPDAHLRDGARAVALARQACQATNWQHPLCLGTLGAALAETGAFDEAIRWQTKALDLYPEEEKPTGLARLELYQAGQPYHE